MADVLVAEDSKVDRILVENILTKDPDLNVEVVENGAQALDAVARSEPDLLVTDLVMPEMDGLELTLKLRQSNPGLPIVIMTAQGSEEIAVKALAAGAASYVPKRIVAYDLLDTVRRVLAAARRERVQQRLMDAMVETRTIFEISSEGDLVPALVMHLQTCAGLMGLSDEGEKTRIGVALQEALVNATHHGNLELSSELREKDLEAYNTLVHQRCREEPYCRRRVRVEALFTHDEARFVVRDQGPGFDPSKLPDPRDPENLQKVSGRGVLLMRSFMDEVRYNEAGNEVVLVKKRAEAG